MRTFWYSFKIEVRPASLHLFLFLNKIMTQTIRRIGNIVPLTLSCLCFLACCLSIQAAESQSVRPNIILIMSDDMGYSDLGCYGGEIQTPTLDSLAAGGIRFTQFYNTARCCPTRASLLTGLHPHQAGIGHMTDDRHLPGYTGDLLPSCVTIAEVLKPAGYATYGVGKWHVTKHLTDTDKQENYPTRRGFDRFYGTISGAGNYFEPATLIRDETPLSPMNDPEYKPDEYYYTTAISDNAVRYIKEHVRSNTDKPFFMYVAYTAAHWPMQALPKDIAKYEGRYDQGYDSVRQARFERMKNMGLLEKRWGLTPKTNEWDNVQNKAWETKCMEVYAAMIDRMDQGVGSIIQSLKETGQYENTVILFLQDNGACAETVGRQARQEYPERVDKPVYEPHPPEKILHRREETVRTRAGYPVISGDRVMPGPRDTFIAYGRGWANVSNTPYREFKHWVHEGGISTPLIVHAPSLMSESMKGKFYSEYGQLVDIMVTCLDLAGAQYPDKRQDVDVTPLQGTSLKPALTGNTLGRKTPLFWEHEGNRAIRDGKWKLVAKGPAAPWELYDMDADRSEMNNLAGKYQDIAEKMATQWEKWAEDAHVFPWPWAQYQRRFQLTNTKIVPLSGIVFDMTFGIGKLKDISNTENVFTVSGASRSLQRNGVFNGETWITIEKSDAFDCSDVAWQVDAEIAPDEPNGVIMSQGGLNHGYSLYLKEGKPGFAVRIGGKFHSVMGNDPIKGNVVLSGLITPQRQLALQVDGKTVAEKGIPDLILEMPGDPPIIGHDSLRGVVEPLLPAFKGKMKRVSIYRGGKPPVDVPVKPATTVRSENPPPNIVLMIADDMSFTDIGCYGSPNAKTQRIDSLAAEGMKFDHCYTAIAMCVPLRNMLYSGLFPVRTGSYRNHTDCYPETISMVQYLNQLGYRVGLSGKVHVGPRASFPFEHIPGLTENCVSATDNYTFEHVKEFMTRDSQEPFCLVAAFIQPHVPWTVGDRSQFDPDALKLPPHWADTPETRQCYVEYLAEVSFLDKQVGELLDIIDDSGLKDNTVVVFLSEQGSQFPGAKWTCWEQGLHAGTLVRWSGVVEPGSVSKALIQYTDFVPTFLDIARRGQAPAPKDPYNLDNLGLDGTSFLDVLEGKTSEHGKYAYGIHNNNPEGSRYPIRSVRTKQFSYIRNYCSEEQYTIKWIQLAKDQPYYPSWRREAEKGDLLAVRAIKRNEYRPAEELYDLTKDPWEMNNLVDSVEHQDILKELQEALSIWMEQQKDPGPSLDVPVRR